MSMPSLILKNDTSSILIKFKTVENKAICLSHCQVARCDTLQASMLKVKVESTNFFFFTPSVFVVVQVPLLLFILFF